MAVTARDVMSTKLILIQENDTLHDAIEVCLSRKVSGAPVVNDQGRLAGVISEYQLMEVIYSQDAAQMRVKDTMTKDVITVTEETCIDKLASLFIVHRIRRLPVVRGNELVGVVTRGDLLRHFLKAERGLAGSAVGAV
jgi:CBS domain-containing protein